MNQDVCDRISKRQRVNGGSAAIMRDRRRFNPSQGVLNRLAHIRHCGFRKQNVVSDIGRSSPTSSIREAQRIGCNTLFRPWMQDRREDEFAERQPVRHRRKTDHNDGR